MSLFKTYNLASNILRYHSTPKKIRDKILNALRRKMRKLMGGKTGDGLSAAHGLDSVAGGFLHKYIGLRDNWANSMIGTLWKDNYLKIEPGKFS